TSQNASRLSQPDTSCHRVALGASRPKALGCRVVDLMIALIALIALQRLAAAGAARHFGGWARGNVERLERLERLTPIGNRWHAPPAISQQVGAGKPPCR